MCVLLTDIGARMADVGGVKEEQTGVERASMFWCDRETTCTFRFP